MTEFQYARKLAQFGLVVPEDLVFFDKAETKFTASFSEVPATHQLLASAAREHSDNKEQVKRTILSAALRMNLVVGSSIAFYASFWQENQLKAVLILLGIICIVIFSAF